MLKVGAIGSIFALRFALVRRNKAKDESATQAEPVEVAAPAPRNPHPVSKKKKRRRRRPA
jgi:hypothetical protein